MTASYWERRYARGGNSGAGSRGREADYKAERVSQILGRYRIRSLLDLGAGDGYVAARLLLGDCHYLGVEPSDSARALARIAAPHLEFVPSIPARPAPGFDCCLSMDVVFHLLDDAQTAAYFAELFGWSDRYVLIYGTCAPSPRPTAPHVRHHDWRPFVPREFKPLPITIPPPRGTDFKTFYLLERWP